MNDIIIKHLAKRYGERVVFADFSAQFPAGGLYGIIGPSGAGKTTLFRLLMGLDQPDAGSITGVPARFSAVFQEDRLCEDFSARCNCHLAAPQSSAQEIKALLSQLGLDEQAQCKPVSALSGGMRRRVAIARALLFPGDMLFFDEPFKGLDARTKENVMATVLAHRGLRTLLFITHDPEDAARLGATLIPIGI